MATTAGEIIDQARDYSSRFSLQNVPDMGALKALERLQRQLAETVAQENPEALATWFEVEGLPEDWEDGVVLPENLGVLGAEAEWEDGTLYNYWEVTILHPSQTLTMPHLYPSTYVVGNKIFLTDIRRWYGTVHGWENLVTLRIRYVPAIGTLTNLDTLITLPDTAVAALVPLLALWMADRTGTNLPTLREAAGASGGSWVNYMTGLSPRSWFVEVVE